TLCFFFFILTPPPLSTLFPYTTLFRSHPARRRPRAERRHGGRRPHPPGHHQAVRHLGPRGVRHRQHRDRALGPDVHAARGSAPRSEEHTSELQSLAYLVCRLLLEKKKK